MTKRGYYESPTRSVTSRIAELIVFCSMSHYWDKFISRNRKMAGNKLKEILLD